MRENKIAKILAEHADRLQRGERINVDEFVSRAPAVANELRVLLQLAEKLQRALVPLAPTRIFRDRLREGLLLAANHRRIGNVIQIANPRPWRYWWVGAAALGSAVAAGGIIAWVVRTRHRSPLLAPARFSSKLS